MILFRSVLFNVFFFAGTFVLTLIGSVVAVLAPHRVLAFAQGWARLMLWSAHTICGIRWQIVGKLPDGAAVIASHHESTFDTLLWLAILPRPAYVMKQELQRIPLFGRLTRLAGMIAVDRSAGVRAMRRLMRDAAAAAAEQRQIVIFPEGTRAAPGTLLPLHPGVAAVAAGTRLPVIPVLTDSGRCWGRRAFRKQPGLIQVVLLPPLRNTAQRDLLRLLQQALQTDLKTATSVENSVG